MKLTRKQITQLGTAGKIFNDAMNSNKKLVDLIPVSARMILSFNAKNVKDSYEFIQEEQKRILAKNLGVDLLSFGFNFFKSQEEVDAFEKEGRAKLQEDINKILKENTDNEVIISKELKEVFIKAFPFSEEANNNRINFTKEWAEFIENETDTMDLNVNKIKISDFNFKSKEINTDFIENYIDVGLVEF